MSSAAGQPSAKRSHQAAQPRAPRCRKECIEAALTCLNKAAEHLMTARQFAQPADQPWLMQPVMQCFMRVMAALVLLLPTHSTLNERAIKRGTLHGTPEELRKLVRATDDASDDSEMSSLLLNGASKVVPALETHYKVQKAGTLRAIGSSIDSLANACCVSVMYFYNVLSLVFTESVNVGRYQAETLSPEDLEMVCQVLNNCGYRNLSTVADLVDLRTKLAPTNAMQDSLIGGEAQTLCTLLNQGMNRPYAALVRRVLGI